MTVEARNVVRRPTPRGQRSHPTLRTRRGVAVRIAAAGLASLIVAAAAAHAAHRVLVSREDRSARGTGRLVQVGGRSVYIDCRGHGAPTVVLEPGAGHWSVHWRAVQAGIESEARTCVYDRPGYGLSEPGPGPRSPLTIARELKAALARAGERPPFLLVGHSFGGLVARAFAAEHPEQTVALVLVDAAHEEQWDRLPGEVRGFLETSLAQMRVASLVAPFGVLRLAATGIARPRLSDDLQRAHEAGVSRAEHYRAFVAEATSSLDGTARAELRRRPLPASLRLTVLSAERSFDAFRAAAPALPFGEANRMWDVLQGELGDLTTNSRRVVVPLATHAINVDRPDLVAGVVREELRRVRDGAR